MFRTLLVPLDHSALAEQALGPAIAIANATKARLDVTVVHQPPESVAVRHSAWNDAQVPTAEQYLAGLCHTIGMEERVTTTHAVLQGDVADSICARARDIGADLMVITSHGRMGMGRAALGPVADVLVRKSKLPVLLLRPHEGIDSWRSARSAFSRILVPIDGSALSHEILSHAVALAGCSDGRLTLIRVVQPVPFFRANSESALGRDAVRITPMYSYSIQDMSSTAQLCDEARSEMAECVAMLEKQGVRSVETHVVVANSVATAIADFATGFRFDAIAMSTHGRGDSRWLLGSITDAVVRSCNVPILLYHPARVRAENLVLNTSAALRQLPSMAGV